MRNEIIIFTGLAVSGHGLVLTQPAADDMQARIGQYFYQIEKLFTYL